MLSILGLAILANTPNQAETLLHSLEQAAVGIGLHVNAHKTKYMCYNQTGNISTLDGTFRKLVDKFTYQESSVSSTEKDIDTRLTKACMYKHYHKKLFHILKMLFLIKLVKHQIILDCSKKIVVFLSNFYLSITTYF